MSKPLPSRRLCTSPYHQGPRWMLACYFYVLSRERMRLRPWCATCCRTHKRACSSLVDNEPLRMAFLMSPLRATDVCGALGWVDSRGAQTGRLMRALGIAPEWGGGRRQRIGRERAAAIAQAMGLDPVDVGL